MIKKHRIDFVNRYFHPVSAGIETTLFQIIRHIPVRKFSVTVHTSADTLSHPNSLPAEEKLSHVHIRRYRTFKKIFFPHVPWQETDTVVISNFTLMPHMMILLTVWFLKVSRKKNFIFLFFPNGGFTPDWKSFSPGVRLVKKLVHGVSAALINYAADTVIAISGWERENLLRSGISSKRITTMPLGVEDEAFQLPVYKNPRKTPYIIQVSRIHPVKNIETAIRALPSVKGPLDLFVAGAVEDEGYFQTLKQLVADLHLESAVTFTGPVTVEEKYALIDNAFCMVHMSENESFGLSIHEAMSRGKLVIVADNTAQPEAVKNGVHGFSIPTHSAETLAQQLTYLMTEKGLSEMRAIESANKTAMKKYRWKEVSGHFVDCAMGNADL